MGKIKGFKIWMVFLFFVMVSGLIAAPQAAAMEAGELYVSQLLGQGYQYLGEVLDAEVDKKFQIRFTRDIDFNTIDTTISPNIELVEKETNAKRRITIQKIDNRTIAVVPDALLERGKTYYVIVKSGSNPIRSIDGTKSLVNGVIAKAQITGSLINTGFLVQNVNLASPTEVEVVFNDLLDDATAVDANNYTLDGKKPYRVIFDRREGKSVRLKFSPSLSYEVNAAEVVVKENVKSVSGRKLPMNYSKHMIVMNREAARQDYEYKVVNKNISILAPYNTLMNAEVKGDVYIAGMDAVLEGVNVAGTLFIDTGEGNSAYLYNVKADKIVVLSGGDRTNPLILEDVDTDILHIKNKNQEEEVGIVSAGTTEIYKTEIEFLDSSVHLENKGGSFGRVEVSPRSNPEGVLSLQGNFGTPIMVYRASTIIAEDSAEIAELYIEPKTKEEINLMGDFKLVEIKQSAIVNLEEDTIVRKMILRSLGVEINEAPWSSIMDLVDMSGRN